MSDIFGIQADDIEQVARKIKNAADSYAKMDVFDEFDVDWGDRKPALWALVNQGHYDAWNDPAIWSELTENIEFATPENLVEFLAQVENYDEVKAEGDEASASDDGYEDEHYEDEYYEDEYYDDEYGGGGYVEPPFESQRLVSFWPVPLDVMAMHAYAGNAELVESRMSDFHAEVQKGLQLVRLRFGKIAADALPEGTVDELAKTHVWRSLPWYAWDVVDGELTKLEIGRQDGEGPAQKQAFIANFADDSTWANAVLEAIFLEDYGPNFQSTLEAWPIANLEQLESMISNISIYGNDRVTAFELMLGRSDVPSDLLAIAKNLDEDSRWHQAEFAAVTAVLQAKANGENPPAEALTLISFRSLDNPYRRNEFFTLPYLADALRTFDEDQVVARMCEVFDGDYTKTEPFPALKVYPTNATLMQKARETVETIASGDHANFSSMNKPAFGFALLGVDALKDVADAFDASSTPLVRDTYRRAILGILADADAAQDPAYDRFISLVDFQDTANTRDHDLGNYVGDDYRAALGKLPAERASLRVAQDLDAGKPNWQRALAAVKEVHTPEVLDKAFGMLAQHGLPPNNGFDWFGPLLSDYEFRDTLKPFIGPALAAAKSPDFHNAIKNQFGEEQYAQMLSEAGAESVADKGPADKIHRLSAELFESRPNLEKTVVYVFSRTDEQTGTMNRVGGRPFGVTAETWPLKNGDADSPMNHVVTLDIDTVPGLRNRYKDEVRAVSLFLRTPGSNQAYGPGNSDAEVVIVSRDQSAEYEGAMPAGDPSGQPFTVDEIEVPFEAWTVQYGTDPELERLRSAIYSLSAWVGGGGPIWLQGDAHFGMPIMQFDEGFANVNLGDMGIMYVFDDTAFWQCH